MAYVSKNLATMIPRLGTGEDVADGSAVLALHSYRSSADNVAAIIAAGYIDDGNDKGIKLNDIVIVVDDLASVDLCLVTVVTAGGDVTMIQLA